LLKKTAGPVKRYQHLQVGQGWCDDKRLCYILHRQSHSPDTVIPDSSFPAAIGAIAHNRNSDAEFPGAKLNPRTGA
jgi:hypothetical protein